MSDNIQTLKGWSSVQVYTLSAICLLIGLTMGYLFRGSTTSQAPGTQTETGSKPAGKLPDNPTQPTPEAMKRMAEKQVEPLLEQLKSNPNDADTLGKIAHYYMVAGQTKDATTYYEKQVAAKPSAEAYTNLANAYYYGGQGDKAIEALNQALKLDPKSANALYNLGMLKWQVKGDTKGAIESWETLIKTNPNHPQVDKVKKLIAKAKEHANMPAGGKTDKPAM